MKYLVAIALLFAVVSAQFPKFENLPKFTPEQVSALKARSANQKQDRAMNNNDNPCPRNFALNIVRDESVDLIDDYPHGNSITFRSCDRSRVFGSIPAGAVNATICLPKDDKFVYEVTGGESIPNVGFSVRDLDGPFNWTVFHFGIPPFIGKSPACQDCPRGRDKVYVGTAWLPGSVNVLAIQDCAGKRLEADEVGDRYAPYDDFFYFYVKVDLVCLPKKYNATTDTGAAVDFYVWDLNAKELVAAGESGYYTNCDAAGGMGGNNNGTMPGDMGDMGGMGGNNNGTVGGNNKNMGGNNNNNNGTGNMGGNHHNGTMGGNHHNGTMGGNHHNGTMGGNM